MILPYRFGKCIWCFRPLNLSSAGADDSASNEHIFPDSIFGVATTRDCCKRCNSRLGHEVDAKLLKDERILLAAREAGIIETELLSQISARGLDSLNREVRYTIKEGKWRLEPKFDFKGFRIGMIEGKIFPEDIKNAKAKIKAISAADESLQFDAVDFDECVRQLVLAQSDTSGKEDSYCHKFEQKLRIGHGPSQVRIDGAYNTWETE